MKKIILICLAITCYTNAAFGMLFHPDHALHPRNISKKDINTLESIKAIFKNEGLQRTAKDSRIKTAILQAKGNRAIKILRDSLLFLHLLTRHNLINTIKLLVNKHKSDVNVLWKRENRETTALWASIDRFRPEIALYLLSKGANPHIPCKTDSPQPPYHVNNYITRTPQTAYELVKAKRLKAIHKFRFLKPYLVNALVAHQQLGISSSQKYEHSTYLDGENVYFGYFSLDELIKGENLLIKKINIYKQIIDEMEKYKS